MRRGTLVRSVGPTSVLAASSHPHAAPSSTTAPWPWGARNQPAQQRRLLPSVTNAVCGERELGPPNLHARGAFV